jgi:type I restriction enzyme S subunit
MSDTLSLSKGEWKEYTLGELIDEGRANLQTGPFGTMLSASEYSPNGIPVIAVQDIGENKLLHHKFVFVNQDVANRLSRYKVQENDIIFGRKGAVERRALIKKSEEGWLQGSDCIRLRFDDSINTKYISYQMGRSSHKDWMFQYSTGATMPSLNQEILKLLPLKLPSLPEQNIIASILSSLDDKIDLLHRQNKILEQLAETLFRQWFVLEEHEDWEEKSLDQIADYLNGLACQKYPPLDEINKLPVIKIKDIKNGFSDNSDWVTSEVPQKYIIERGDILFSWSGSLEVMIWAYGKGVLNQHLFKVSSVEYPKWLYYFATKLHLDDFRVIAESKSTTMGHIQREHLSAAKIKIPSDENILKQMDNTFSPLINKIIINFDQIDSLTKMRDTLLPKLMSGEISVRV